ncbi:MAG: uroporphyrinogen decarboxylase family protein [Candidatus Omnitrophica bacterium]|nr:uroporphyrinogen decarboxylase family protein [Candidatus Omnitrophota bacterium]
MTMKRRMLGILRGNDVDKIPFVQYYGMTPLDEAWNLVGRDNLGLLKWTQVHQFITPDCVAEKEYFERNGIRGQRHIIHTPIGSIFEEVLYERIIGGGSIKKHFIKEKKDYEIFLFYLRNIIVKENLSLFLKDLEILGDDGLPHTSLGRTAYQQLWIQWVLIDELCQHLVDFPDLMEEVIKTMNEIHRKIFLIVRNVARQCQIPYVVFGDNITAPMIGERYFRKYCLPVYQMCAEILDGTGILIGVHMDGDLKPLWDAIKESSVRVIDSMSVPPDNDTSVADAIRLWPETRLLINFPSSVHLKSSEEIYQKAMEILNQGGKTKRIWIQVSENMPPGVWLKSYPAIVRAINDFKI